MTHTIQNSIIIFHYNEKIEEHKNIVFINALLNFKNLIVEKQIRGIFISIKNIPHSNENIHFEDFLKQLDKASQKLTIPIALGDYDKATFDKLKSLTSQTQVKLFQNITAATLFLNPGSFKKQLSILVYEEDAQNVDKLSSELVKLGYVVVHAQDLVDFKQKASLKNYDMTITQNAINLKESTLNPIAKSLPLSKQLILNLPTFIDTAVNSLVTITGLEAQKIKHDIMPFNEKLGREVIIAAMKFKGDISGSFFLIFPRDIAIIALESMLGESIDSDDMDSITDGIGEFCNIITGSAKAIFSNKEIKVLFELPKTYTSLKSAMNDTSGDNGIWIDMQLNGKPFYMFVTK